MVMDPTLPRISVRDLMMQAFLTGWELSDKTVSQDEYLQSSIQVKTFMPKKALACRTAKKWIIWTTGCVPTASGCTTV